jgi:hypothetical protein
MRSNQQRLSVSNCRVREQAKIVAPSRFEVVGNTHPTALANAYFNRLIPQMRSRLPKLSDRTISFNPCSVLI